MFKIAPNEAGTLRGDMYSIDQGGHAPADVTLKGSAVRIVMPAVGATYIGKLSADGNSITGKWTGPNGGLTLNLVRAIAETAWKIPQLPPPPKPMADPDPAFDVATIKPPDPALPPFMFFNIRGREFITHNTSLNDLIKFAWGIHVKQIIGAPAWLGSEKYDLAAKPGGEGVPNEAPWKTKLQKLLADRFQLKFHQEQKRAPGVRVHGGKEWIAAHEERRRSERASTAGFQGPGLPAREQRDHGGVCRGYADSGARSADSRPDEAAGKVRLRADVDAG